MSNHTKNEESIKDYCVDELSDLSVSDIESSESNISESESDNEDVQNIQSWSTIDTAPKLEPFNGDPGVKIMPNSIDNISDIVNLFIGDDLFTYMVEESNRYYEQNCDEYKTYKKTLKWKNITLQEMKKFCGLILLMGQIRKDAIAEYWSTEPSLETPFFSKVMSRERFRQIWQFWHFNNNENKKNSNKLQKVEVVLSYFRDKFNNVYSPARELSFEQTIIPWRGKIIYKAYNPTKLSKYGILLSMIYEAKSGYICNFKTYSELGQIYEETIFSVLEPYNYKWHHIYLNNYLNIIDIPTGLLNFNFRICGIVKNQRGIPKQLKNIKLSIGETSFLRKDDTLLQIWRPKKKKITMISTIHSALIKNTYRTNRQSGHFLQNPECFLQYNKYMKGVDRANEYLSYYKIICKTNKWAKKVVIYFLNCALFNAYKVYIILNGYKMSYKKFLHKIAIKWIENIVLENDPTELTRKSETSDINTIDNDVLTNNSQNNIVKPGPSKLYTTPKTSRYDPPERLSADLKKHFITKIVTPGNKKFPQRQCKVCAASNKKRLTSFICKFCIIPLHKGYCFERYHSVEKY